VLLVCDAMQCGIIISTLQNDFLIAFSESFFCYVCGDNRFLRNGVTHWSNYTVSQFRPYCLMVAVALYGSATWCLIPREEIICVFRKLRLGVDGWIILGWISRRWDVGMWTGLGWPRIVIGGGRL